MKLRDALTRVTSEGLERMQKRFEARFDAWENPLTGFGTTRDKTTYTKFGAFERLADVDLSNLYHGDDMAARMVDIVPQEMFRKGFTVDLGDPDLNTWINEKLDNLDAPKRFCDAIRWARLFGGSALLIGADDGQDASLPLDPDRVEAVRYLYTIDRRLLWPVSYYTEAGHPKLGEPETYMVSPIIQGGASSASVSVVHESRLIIFRGAPTGNIERLAWAHWDISVLQRPHEILRQFNTGWKAVEIMLTDGNQAIFKMTGLAESIGSEGSDYVQKRMNVIEMYRSVLRALVIDADSEESYERAGVSFGSVPETLDKFMLRLAAAVQIPVTILMGQSPAGMSATGDSDFRWFYDRIESEQTTECTPKLRRLVRMILATEEPPKDIDAAKLTINVIWPPLWTETPSAEATRRLSIAQADAAYLTAGVYLPEEVALSRARPDGFNAEMQISEEGRKAREDLLKSSLKQLAAGTPPAPPGGALPPAGGAAPGSPAPAPPGAPPAKLDAADSNLPRTGANRFGNGGGGEPSHAPKFDSEFAHADAAGLATVDAIDAPDAEESGHMHAEAAQHFHNAATLAPVGQDVLRTKQAVAAHTRAADAFSLAATQATTKLERRALSGLVRFHRAACLQKR